MLFKFFYVYTSNYRAIYVSEVLEFNKTNSRQAQGGTDAQSAAARAHVLNLQEPASTMHCWNS